MSNDIKVVIELDKDLYEGIAGKNDCEVEPRVIVRDFQATIADAIANGTPLPKGHGRLGDLDLLEKTVRADTNYLCAGDKNEALFNIVSLPTIVEAENETDN